MNWRFIRQVILCAILFLFLCLILDGLIFLISHVPPKAINLDKVILILGKVARFLASPKFILRRLWPGEATPAGFSFVLSVMNCLIWGLAIVGLKNFWSAVRR